MKILDSCIPAVVISMASSSFSARLPQLMSIRLHVQQQQKHVFDGNAFVISFLFIRQSKSVADRIIVSYQSRTSLSQIAWTLRWPNTTREQSLPQQIIFQVKAKATYCTQRNRYGFARTWVIPQNQLNHHIYIKHIYETRGKQRIHGKSLLTIMGILYKEFNLSNPLADNWALQSLLTGILTLSSLLSPIFELYLLNGFAISFLDRLPTFL